MGGHRLTGFVKGLPTAGPGGTCFGRDREGLRTVRGPLGDKDGPCGWGEGRRGPWGQGPQLGPTPGEGLQAARGLAWELGHSTVLPTLLLPAPPAPSPPKAEPFLLPLLGCSSWPGPGQMGPSFLKAHAGPLMTRLVAPEPPPPPRTPS